MDTTCSILPARQTQSKATLVSSVFFLLLAFFFLYFILGVIGDVLFGEEGPFVDGIARAVGAPLMLLFLLPFIGFSLTGILSFFFSKQEFYGEDTQIRKVSFYCGIKWSQRVIPVVGDEQLAILLLDDERELYASASEKALRDNKGRRSKTHHLFLLRTGYRPVLLLNAARLEPVQALAEQLQQCYPSMSCCDAISPELIKAKKTLDREVSEDEEILSKRRKLKSKLRVGTIGLIIACVVNAFLSADAYLHPDDARDWVAVDAALADSYQLTSSGRRHKSTTSYGHFCYRYDGQLYQPERIELDDVECISAQQNLYRLYVRSGDPEIHACAIYGEQSKLRATLLSLLGGYAGILLLIASFFIRTKKVVAVRSF